MNSCVVEFEAFQCENGQFIVKELAITDVEHCTSRVVILKPPFERSRLSTKYKRVAEWLVNYYHGISWNEGTVDYKQLQSILHDVSKTYSTIYTKGLEKTRFLSDFHKKVIDLNDMNVSKYDNTLNDDTLHRCEVKKHNYSVLSNFIYNCALRKAEHYAKWLRNNIQPLEPMGALKTFASLAKRGLFFDGVGVKCKTCGTYVYTRP